MENREKLDKIKAEFGNPFAIRSFLKPEAIGDVLEHFQVDKEISVAGRIITKREHGKSSFAHISDVSGKIQIFAQLNMLGEAGYRLFKELDVGDIIGIKGKLFITRTEEKTVAVGELVLLSKCLRSLPEKWHGLKDTETRYRQRYLDLISSQSTRDVFLKRIRIIDHIRDFFRKERYCEVETPMLQLLPGGAAGSPFATQYHALGQEVYLRIAPELYLKRLLVGGFDRVFEINRNFRNEGISTRHSPEFTMLEAYATYQDYQYMMKLCEDMISSLVKKIYGKYEIEYQGQPIDFTPPWERISFIGLFEKEFAVSSKDSAESVLEKVKAKLDLSDTRLSRTQVLNITEELIEKNYPKGKPAFVIDFFSWMSPLAKTKSDDPCVAERFELFVAGLELANSYSELNDPIEQEEKFRAQLKIEEELPKKIDNDFLLSLQYGMPPAAGLGIGIDRLVMILLDQPSIRDVILFPLLKPLQEQ
ncbi:MAG: lysine--tRNA ligase [Candidatus Omnitrophica bacterium]|nr:lysine--tRNA ligase [Candidatus Omnitrophota bacterium]